MDLAIRQLAQVLQADLGQPVIIENRTGAGTLVGTEAVARAAPDGHTVLIAANSFVINAALRPNLSYDPLRDFVPIALLTVVPHVLVAHPSVAADFAGFLEAARRPGKGLSFGSYGVGTSNHIGAEQLKLLAGLNATHVPYRGAQAEVDLLAGRIDFMLANLPNVLQPVAAGQLKALTVAAPQRSRHLPEVPPLTDLGFPILSDSWFGVVAPAGLRPEVTDRHSAAWLAGLDRPEVRADFERRGLEVLGIGPAEFAARLRRDLATYTEVVRAANIKPE
ncbi:tripartite tricarboxylate transporter substrate binding protein [Belnapia sp. T6]|uniref:Tripartite tricarboxylate transporter substrate binding protein n=1 Tax=Belnapia mucosa TaxID=2804532 RepID=A0ABS1VC04_9PROT|nr:tripartite tricarboxylate transporter substrate-binding protein [Belnapia mucosa]MBL6459205.1 tripartite tricarboxylate transporter substrate binding protein [Belnapia mucosa]